MSYDELMELYRRGQIDRRALLRGLAALAAPAIAAAVVADAADFKRPVVGQKMTAAGANTSFDAARQTRNGPEGGNGWMSETEALTGGNAFPHQEAEEAAAHVSTPEADTAVGLPEISEGGNAGILSKAGSKEYVTDKAVLRDRPGTGETHREEGAIFDSTAETGAPSYIRSEAEDELTIPATKLTETALPQLPGVSVEIGSLSTLRPDNSLIIGEVMQFGIVPGRGFGVGDVFALKNAYSQLKHVLPKHPQLLEGGSIGDELKEPEGFATVGVRRFEGTLVVDEILAERHPELRYSSGKERR